MITQRHIVAIIIVSMTFVTAALGATEKVLYTFSGGSDGATPYAPIVFDAQGNIYGTTTFGGSFGAGTVFELTPSSNGGWTESVLYSFTGGTDGGSPYFGALVFNAQGNLYGTTLNGGAYGYGTVFELVRNSNGSWTETVLYSFTGGKDGGNPYAGLIFDAAGNLYGTTTHYGVYGYGVAFKLTPGSGGWTQRVLHSFWKYGGADPTGTLIFDGAGRLYGTLTLAGGHQAGAVFRLTHTKTGWKYADLYRFTGGSDGGDPVGGLTLDSSGNLYGTSQAYGGNGAGNAFELEHSNTGWNEVVICTFSFFSGAPSASMIFDAAGNLYGTDSSQVFELSPNGGGWTETVLYTFSGGSDGGAPSFGGVVADSQGNFYGTTGDGGNSNYGVVYEITP